MYNSLVKIWIDGYEANVAQRLGSGQVAFNLLKSIEKIDQENDYTVLLPTPPLPDLPKVRPGWRYQILRPARLWTRIALPLKIIFSNNRPDVFFSPTHYIPKFNKVKRVVMIFDLAFLHFPEMFKKGDLYKLKNWTKDSVTHAEHVITISESSKKDMKKYYNKDVDKVTVAYPGFDSEKFKVVSKEQIKTALTKYKIESDYVIFVGTLQPRKNLLKLIDALKEIDNLKLVIVGKTTGQGRSGWMFDEILKHPKKIGVEGKVIFTGFVPTEDLVPLINGAEAFILPSLYEGFGIPILEAMACGVPVIASNNSSLPEVVGKTGVLIDPTSVEDIKGAILKVTQDRTFKEKLSKEGLQQVKRFSWEKMAREVITVLEKVGGKV